MASASTNDSSLPIAPAVARRWNLFALFAILVTTSPWWIALTCPFINFDDPAYIATNPHVLAGLSPSAVLWAFTTTNCGFWFPITWLSLLTDATLFGPNPLGFHLTNVLLHILNVGLVFMILQKMTAHPARSLLVALLFATHPLRVESVAWATERKDVLTVFFGLLALWQYTLYVHHGRSLNYLLTLLFYALALLAKPMLVTLPFLLLLLDFAPLNRMRSHPSGKRLRFLLLEKVPLLIMAIVISCITYSIQLNTNAKAYEPLKPLVLRLKNIPPSYLSYLRQTFYFNDLSIYYNDEQNISIVKSIAAAIFLLAITFFLIVIAKKRRNFLPLIGWLWFIGTLVPAIGLVQSGNQTHADRFIYFPTIGLFIALVWLYPCRWTMKQWQQKTASLLAASIVLLLMIATTLQLMLWRDPLRLYLSGLSHTHGNWFLESLAAYEFQQRGQIPQAIEHYESVVSLAPYMHEPENNLGGLLVHTGHLREALPHLQRAHELDPANPIYAANYEKLASYLQSHPPASAPISFP